MEATTSFAFDRAAISALFHVSQRQAANLLDDVGAEKIGGAYIVPRARLLAYLDGRAEDTATRKEQDRKLAVALKLSGIRAAGPPMRAVRVAQSRPDNPLPPGITVVGPGELRVLYDSPNALLGVILGLAELSETNPRAYTASLEFRRPEGEEDE